MVAALALVQRVEEAIKERLGEKECISEFGEAIYPFLASCGIDAKSIMEVTGLFTHVIEMRNEFFPNATFCATETLERLLSLLFPALDVLPRHTVDKWSFILYFQEETVYNRVLHKTQQERCGSCERG